MEVLFKQGDVRTNIFAEFNSISVIDLMCLKKLIDIVTKGKSKLSYLDFAYEIVSEYWNTDLSKVEQSSEIKLFNEIKNTLIIKYGLSMISMKEDVTQILKYMNDKQVNIKLLGMVKKSLSYLRNPIDNNKITNASFNYWNNYLISEWKCNNDLFETQGQNEIIIDKNWVKYIYSNKDTIYRDISNCLQALLNGESLVVKEYNNSAFQSDKEEFLSLEKLEKRIKFHQMLNKKNHICLEVAYDWLSFKNEDYVKLKLEFDSYINRYGIKITVQNYPFVTSLILIFTAIYRYNDEDSNGYWPEFFGKGDYQYKDALLAMEVLKEVADKFNINSEDRRYLEKTNLSEIFSQIYIPEVSIRKIYSAIYKYYFRYSNNQRIASVHIFLEDNTYRLDKPGIFFLSEDKIIDNPFNKIMEMFNNCLDNKENIEAIDYLPKRFLTSFEKWIESDKVDIDSQKEEYYIANPRIRFDIPNEKLLLMLPQQRSKTYSDEICGWNIFIDDSPKKFIDGRIIKRKDGVYIVLDEEIELTYYENIKIEYVFNNKVVGKWQIENTNSFILFNEYGYYLKSDKLNRSKCVIGIINSEYKDQVHVLDKITLKNWKGYIFYYLDLEDISQREIVFSGSGKEIIFEIDDRPSVKRNSYKLAFEKRETSPHNFEGINIYEDIGTFSFHAPNIDANDIEVRLRPLNNNNNFEYSSCYRIRQKNSNSIEIDFDKDKLPKGYYSLLISCKERTITKETFILIDPIEYNDGFGMSYEKINNKHEKFILEKGLHYQIEPSHITCLVSEDMNNYYIEPSNVAKVRFNLLVHGITVPISKVILPIRWDITGLETVVDNKDHNQVREISKQAFDNSDIRLQIINYDYRYKTLTYKLEIKEINNNESIVETRKLGYGDQFNFQFKNIRDRLIDFHNISIKIVVLNEEQEILYEQIILNVAKKIKMLNLKSEFIENVLIISWDEEYSNKSRILKLYNYINPWKNPLEFELSDGITEVIVALDKIDYGYYLPVLDYKKEYSLFDNIQEKRDFFKKNDIKNIIANDIAIKVENEDFILGELLQCYANGQSNNSQLFEGLKNTSALSISKVFMTLTQMRYFTVDQNHVETFIKDSFRILNLIISREGYERVLNGLLNMTNYLNNQDMKLCVTMLLATRKDKEISNEKIDLLSEINIIDALCSVKNGSGALTSNLKSRCVSTFERELLSIARKHKEISNVVRNEIEIINSFWSWITEYKNSYILKYDYSLPRAFRIYEFEKDISTMKVNGNKIDDLVENIKCDNNCSYFKLPEELANRYKITKEQFNTIKDLLETNMNDYYRSLLISAFLSIVPVETMSDDDYYKMIMEEYFGKRWELFERYRAFFKLIFI
ncbi:hypothetical protein SAMN05660462_01313 [Proteiniborus ethanoligenes]|uniref:Uncharacterized protein n=1 Tax=Proteiniborus ethanoligenes TaxID=415015 RepID=A0A1H3P026_9FIRM|nr:hypothetical protein [Proteiniborus ethanoligenes]SDY94477.1 hypothetical protein SAMN05660462_01313 [Proteiniborus ethanoligenes]